jgi:hypothetical protein
MIKLLLKQIIAHKTQIFFCALGLFLARETYFQIAFPYVFDEVALTLTSKLKLAIIASLFWLPLILAVPLSHLPVLIRRIFAVWQMPGFIALLLLLLAMLFQDIPNAFDGGYSISPDQFMLLVLGLIGVAISVIAIGYFEIQLCYEREID